jgi:hypothetical protein
VSVHLILVFWLISDECWQPAAGSKDNAAALGVDVLLFYGCVSVKKRPHAEIERCILRTSNTISWMKKILIAYWLQNFGHALLTKVC